LNSLALNYSSMESNGLFGEILPQTAAKPVSDVEASPRLRQPDRNQVLMRPCSLEELIPAGHEVRTLWAVVEKLDLSGFYQALKARGQTPGRAATDPRLLTALWLWASTQGEGSAREVARLCERDDTYKWLCGGVSINHHSLSDFHVDHEAALDELFTLVLAMLMEKELVSVKRISQDGMRVRASAGQSSFKRRETAEKHLAAAREQIELLKLMASDPANDERSAREKAAAERAAREREQRVSAALARLPELEAIKKKHNGKKSKQPPRASITDAEARVMKMGDGGFRPAYNVQLSQDTDSRAIVGVDVTTAGTDHDQSEPMRQQVQNRTEERVEEHLVDGGFVKLEVIQRAEEADVKMYAPPKATKARPEPYTRCEKDTDQIAAWRERMGTEAAKRIYKLRAATAETVNGDLRTYRGLDRLLVRGISKVRCVVMWSALAYNLMHFGAALLS
jgi:transposase